MALGALISDAELLNLSLASTSLTGIVLATRAEHIQGASDYVRSKLAPRVSSAMSASFAPSFEVKLAVAAIAAYTLLGYRGYSPIAGADKSVENRKVWAEDWLEAIRTGKAELIGYATDRGAPKVGGTGTSSWENWRNGGNNGG